MTTAALPEVDFLWLELTNRCNLRCVHCYAESGPDARGDDLLSTDDYLRLLDEGAEIGCRQVQFIGGEPTLNHDLPRLIAHARARDYQRVEVYTNLTWLPEALLASFVEHQVSVATSFYSARPDVHEAITKTKGCFDRTVRNIRRLLATGLPLRAGIIEMEENKGQVEETTAFLRGMGVAQVGVDRLRKIGRAGDESETAAMGELCGNCAGKTLCVGPDGRVAPCIMSKAWSVGSVLESSLTELSRSARLGSVRESIHRVVVAPRGEARVEGAIHGTPFVNCGPCEPAGGPQCNPWCHPGQLCTPCAPKGSDPCTPNGRCTPR